MLKAASPPTTPSTPATDPERARVLTAAVAETARRLKLKSTELTAIIGVSQPSASRLLNGKFLLAEGAKPWELGAHLVRLYRSLSALVGGDDEQARAWLKSANQAFGGRTPLETIRSVEGLVHACDYVDAHRARV
ncbi:MAG: antitoxin Xre/MbcA/ParS toxin-binding domain-containing protein [Gammaproteobacteria bacterium]